MRLMAVAGSAAFLLLSSSAHARVFLGREGVFLSPDRAGMIDGPNEYAYARVNPVQFTDPTGNDVDPEMPNFGEIWAAWNLVEEDLIVWKLVDTRPCPKLIPDWDTVASKLTDLVVGDNVTVTGDPQVWQSRGGAWKALPSYAIGRTIYFTPAAGHLSIESGRQEQWAPTDVPTDAGFRHFHTWVGALVHELVHAAGYSYPLGSAPEVAGPYETLANQIAVLFEDRLSNKGLLGWSTAPFDAGPHPTRP